MSSQQNAMNNVEETEIIRNFIFRRLPMGLPLHSFNHQHQHQPLHQPHHPHEPQQLIFNINLILDIHVHIHVIRVPDSSSPSYITHNIKRDFFERDSRIFVSRGAAATLTAGNRKCHDGMERVKSEETRGKIRPWSSTKDNAGASGNMGKIISLGHLQTPRHWGRRNNSCSEKQISIFILVSISMEASELREPTGLARSSMSDNTETPD